MRILAINSGSSSLKFAVYEMAGGEDRVLSGGVSGIGLAESIFRVTDDGGRVLVDDPVTLTGPHGAIETLLEWLETNGWHERLDAVGYRIVHGGPRYRRPQVVSAELMQALDTLSPSYPEHLPGAIEVVRTVQQAYPDATHVLCFDTAFHRNMPAVAQTVALPPSVRNAGVMRYGFHGLSYEFVMEQLGSNASGDRIVIAHLGNGASMVAVKGGQSIETTMGFSPTGGLVMSTRCGDLDPAIVLYLLRHENMDPEQINKMINKQAGLLGISGLSSDMKELLDAEAQNPDAALAVDSFCYKAKKSVGALAAALGGLDRLVFTGGIGENAPAVRRRICSGLEFLGIDLDARRNDAGAAVISRDGRAVTVQVVKTNEGLMIARHAGRLAG